MQPDSCRNAGGYMPEEADWHTLLLPMLRYGPGRNRDAGEGGCIRSFLKDEGTLAYDLSGIGC